MSAISRWQEAQLILVSNYVRRHVRSARQITKPVHGKHFSKQFRNAPLVAYTGNKRKLEYVISVNVFRAKICNAMSWRRVVHMLDDVGYLNRNECLNLNLDTLLNPDGWADLISLKPTILDYVSAAVEAKRQKAVGLVRDYVAEHVHEAVRMADLNPGELTSERLSKSRLLSYTKGDRPEFIVSKRVFWSEIAGRCGLPPKSVLRLLDEQGFLNTDGYGKLLARRLFAAQRSVRVVSIKPAISKYRSPEEELR